MRIEINEVNDRTEQVWFVILASIVAMVIGCIIAIFVAFIGVGILVGSILATVNYVKCFIANGLFEPKAVIKHSWDKNMQLMTYFFDKTKNYDHILPGLVKPFLCMSGVGVALFGTIVLFVFMILHLAVYIISIPFFSRRRFFHKWFRKIYEYILSFSKEHLKQ